jgi:hypothetical protein
MRAIPSICSQCKKKPPLCDSLYMYCFVCLEINTGDSHLCPNGCPLFCQDECDCVPCRFASNLTTMFMLVAVMTCIVLSSSCHFCSECVVGRGCSQCEPGRGCPTCSGETAAAAAVRLASSKVAQLAKRSGGWCGPRTYNPAAKARKRLSHVSAAPDPDVREPLSSSAVQHIEGTDIAHMLQRLRNPLLHHCEATAIMKQLSTWLNAFWAHSSDPAGAFFSHSSISLIIRSQYVQHDKLQLPVFWVSII